MLDPGVPWGIRYYWKSHYLPDLSDAFADTLAEHAWADTSPRSYALIFHLRGAVGRVLDDAMAFGKGTRHPLPTRVGTAEPDPTDDAIISGITPGCHGSPAVPF